MTSYSPPDMLPLEVDVRTVSGGLEDRKLPRPKIESVWRAGLLCALLTTFAILASRPMLEMGTVDDWSYARTSLELARTGHFIYNGWATAMLGWQILWGAAVIKLFGFSFLALRLSMIPFAAGAAFLLCQICGRFGLNARNAVLATLTVVLSPLYLPLSASFMTDIAGFFFILLCLQACLRALDAKTSRMTIVWLAAATMAAVAGGTGRQIVWLGALVMVPSAAWLLRRRTGVLLATAMMWAGTCAAIGLCLYWFHQQPYSIPEKLIVGKFTPISIGFHLLQQVRDLGLSMLLFALPALAAYLAAIRQLPRKAVAAVFGVAALAIAFRAFGHGAQAFAPWLPNIVTPYGVGGPGPWENLGEKPLVLAGWMRLLLTVTVAAATSCFLVSIASRSRVYRTLNVKCASWKTLVILLAPFSAAYLTLLLPRAAFDVAVDRYLVPLIAMFIIPVMRFYQERVKARAPGLSFAILALFAAYGVAATHDYFATGRARLEAATTVEQSGIPRSSVQGGWEHDGWTQIQQTGYINDWRMQRPAGAYHPSYGAAQLPKQCQFWFSEYTPAVRPEYFVVFSRQSCLAESGFGPVQYRTWLPPFAREIYIQQMPHERLALQK